MAAEEFGGGRRRAGAGVKQGDADLTAGECAVEDREISHDDGQKAEACAGFKDNQFAGRGAVWSDVSETEGEDGCAAYIEIGEESGRLGSVDEWASESEVNESKAEHHDPRPNDEQEDEGHGVRSS